MSTLVHYIAGGALAIMSQAVFTETGLPNLLVASAAPATPIVDAYRAPQTTALQEVDRTNKGDRLVPGVAEHPYGRSEFIARDTVRNGGIRPFEAARPAAQRLPDGCNASISPLSDRVAANQASNCVTSLEVPWRVASAD